MYPVCAGFLPETMVIAVLLPLSGGGEWGRG